MLFDFFSGLMIRKKIELPFFIQYDGLEKLFLPGIECMNYVKFWIL